MIARGIRSYNYYIYGDSNSYGQSTLIKDENGDPVVQGTVKININTVSESIQDNVRYKDSSYIGLTHENINDKYVIQYGDEKLKVLYVNPNGRYKQVFLKNI